MLWFSGFILFFFGASLGSFVNVMVARLPRGQSPWRGRSHCQSCKRPLAAIDLVPILSFLFLAGRCRYCHKPIGWRDFGGEVFMGGAWLVTWLGSLASGGDLALLVTGLLLTSLFVLLFLYDLKTQLLPDMFVWLLIILSLVWVWFKPALNLRTWILPEIFLAANSPWWSALLGALISAGFLGALWLFTKGRGMGLGDVKLAVALGILSGWPMIMEVLFGAFLSGAIVGIILLSRGTKSLKSRLAFGPFLIGAQLLFWWLSLYY